MVWTHNTYNIQMHYNEETVYLCFTTDTNNQYLSTEPLKHKQMNKLKTLTTGNITNKKILIMTMHQVTYFIEHTHTVNVSAYA